MEVKYKFKALGWNVYTEMFQKDGKTCMNVYDEDGELLDVMEEVASFYPDMKIEVPKD